MENHLKKEHSMINYCRNVPFCTPREYSINSQLTLTRDILWVGQLDCCWRSALLLVPRPPSFTTSNSVANRYRSSGPRIGLLVLLFYWGRVCSIKLICRWSLLWHTLLVHELKDFLLHPLSDGIFNLARLTLAGPPLCTFVQWCGECNARFIGFLWDCI